MEREMEQRIDPFEENRLLRAMCLALVELLQELMRDQNLPWHVHARALETITQTRRMLEEHLKLTS
jgi:uncharacterized protein (UPF0147 family)